MSNSSNISVFREHCMKCGEKSDILLSTCTHSGGIVGICDHIFCQSCFIKSNTNVMNNKFRCPCCPAVLYDSIRSIDEAILICEAATLFNQNSHQMLSTDNTISSADATCINQLNKNVIEKAESALQLNPTNFYSLYLIFVACDNGQKLLARFNFSRVFLEFYALRLYDYSFRLIDHPHVVSRYGFVKMECYCALTCVFLLYNNYPAAFIYSKLYYEQCLRSNGHDQLAQSKALYLKSRTSFSKLPPLRFAVGDEVEFLHELETGNEWKRGRIVELYYRESVFDISLSAPYRLQLLEDSVGRPPVYAWVKADLDRYVRKVGVRSIEDTRYQARLDAKVEELARVYCSDEFIQDIYRTLAQDQAFVDMLQSVWEIELSDTTMLLYRMLVMYRQPLTRTDSGYHVLSTEEFIAGFKAYFDPAHLSSDAAQDRAVCKDSDSQRIRADVLNMLRGTSTERSTGTDDLDVQDLLMYGIRSFNSVFAQSITGSHVPLFDRNIDFSIPSELSVAISKVSTVYDFRSINLEASTLTKLRDYIFAWIGVHQCLEKKAGPACECPFVFFFIKYCLDQDLGVPRLALALYDRMNMQLSWEFIRCANPTCELNKLDKSTGKVKFKKCSRCKAVIYCSRECQVAHYPEHKRLCREHLTGGEGS